MTKSLSVFGAALIVASSIAVVAQHRAPDAQTAPPAGADAMFMHAACVTAAATEGDAPKSHVPAHLAQALQLTATQSADIDRIAEQACAAMRQAHQQIHGILTADQLAKLKAMHHTEGGKASLHHSLMEFFKKLHGGK